MVAVLLAESIFNTLVKADGSFAKMLAACCGLGIVCDIV